ncbi:MAG: DUF3311 domain-containing protein [Polyangiaceae bacterium]
MSAPHREPWKWYALLALPLAATLWVPLYNRAEPTFIGIPFFYWYLFLWILVVAALNSLVYFATRDRRGV